MVNDCIEDESEEAFMVGLTSVNELRSSGFSVYPNPVCNVVNIKLATGSINTWKIYSLSGAVLMNGITNENETALDVSKLLPGFYMLELSNSETIIGTKKLTLQR